MDVIPIYFVVITYISCFSGVSLMNLTLLLSFWEFPCHNTGQDGLGLQMVHNARKLRPNWPNLFCWSRGNWSAPNSPNWRLSTGGFSLKLRLVSPHPPPSLASSLVIQVERPTRTSSSNFRPYMSLPFSHLPWSKSQNMAYGNGHPTIIDSSCWVIANIKYLYIYR